MFRQWLDQVVKAELARRTGMSPQAVSGWYDRNFVPVEHWDELRGLLEDSGAEVPDYEAMVDARRQDVHGVAA